MRLLRTVIFLLLVLGGGRALGTHIVGAELYYECLNSTTNQYRLTLIMYRDCATGLAPFDDPIVLFVFDGGNGNLVQTINIPKPANTPQIQPANWDSCVATPYAICVEEGIYTTTAILPPRAGGYNLAWARCCRNVAITNLANPLGEGATFLAHIPDSALAQCNSMPVFNNQPPIFLCANQPFNFDHSATDADGDSLVYRIVNPYTGLDFNGAGAGNNQQNPTAPPPVVNLGNPMGPPPYQTVVFGTGYSFTNPFGSNNFVINSQTGFITVTPNQTGIFVLAISVFEYRNGQLLSENRRDFQIHVLNCLPQGDPPRIIHDLGGLNHSNDTVFVNADEPFCFPVTITDTNATDTLNAFTVSAAFGNGTFSPPLATFTWSGINPINGQICWTPACRYANQTILLIIGARDIGDCPNVSDVFDTVWVHISLPPNAPPVISPNYAGLSVSGDTITVAANEAFCYTFSVTDSNATDTLRAFALSPIFSGPNPPSFTVTGINPLQGQICWKPGCSREGMIIPLTIGASDKSKCNQSLTTQSNVYVKVIVPPNQPPVISSNLAGLTRNGDTLIVYAEDSFCFPFTATDPDAGDTLQLIGLSPIFQAPNPPTITVSGINPLQGNICWTPGCAYDGQTVMLVFGAEDQGKCSNTGRAYDTVWVRITVPPNAGPVLTTSLGGLNVNGDSIFIFANDPFCFSFVLTDPNTGDTLNAYPLSPVFNDPDGPQFTWAGVNPITGQVCWTPGCRFVGQVVPLIFGGRDNARCTSWEEVKDTVYVVVKLPPNRPPVAKHSFAGIPRTVGDTIFVNAQQQFCFTVRFTDPDIGQVLSTSQNSPIFSANPPASVTFSGTNPVTAKVCWTPDCAYEGQLFRVVLGATDNGECNNTFTVFDTVWVKIAEPFTLPPIILTDLSSTTHRGDTILVDVDDSICYNFYIIDRTFDNGILGTFRFEDLNGRNLGYGTWNMVYKQDTIYGRACFKPTCLYGGNLYRMVITGYDKATCPPFDSAQKVLYIKVNTDFLSFAGADVSFCEGTGGVQIQAQPIGGRAPYYYQWGCTDPPNCGFSSPNVANPTVNPNKTTTYYVQVADADGCTSEMDSITVTVLPKPIVDAGPDIFMCEGDPGTFLNGVIVNDSLAIGPYDYQWIPTAGLSNPKHPQPYVKPDTTTIYTLIVTDSRGCSSYTTTIDTLSSVTVTVGKRPIADAGPDRHICFGDSILLNGFAYDAPVPYRYEWTPALGLSDSSRRDPMAGPPQTITYSLVAWSRGCPSKADQATVHVHTLPTADPGSIGKEICKGDSVKLDALAGGDSTATYSYKWSPGYGLDDSTSRAPMAAPDTTTPYFLVVSSNWGCESAPMPLTVTVAPTPLADAGPNDFVCQGDSIRLQGSHSFSGTPPNGTIFYAWEPEDGLSRLFVPDPMAGPQQTVVYTLKVSYGSCSTTDWVKIDVFDPVGNVSVSADTLAICGGDSVRLYAVGGKGNASFTWTPALGLSDPNIASPWAFPSQSTNYEVLIQEGKCSARDTLHLTVHPMPDPAFYHTLPSGCEDHTVNFLATGANVVNYIWDFGDGSPVNNEAHPEHVYVEPGQYPVRLTVIGAGGCTAINDSLWIRVAPEGLADFASDPGPEWEHPLPNAAVAFFDMSEGAVSWLWDFGDGGSSLEANPVHVYTEAGAYYVTLLVTDAEGCTYSVRYGPYLIVAPELFIPNVFTPNDDAVNDRFLVDYSGKEPFRLQIFDRWGVQLHESLAADIGWDGRTPSGSAATEGVYYYVVKIGEKAFTGNVVLMR